MKDETRPVHIVLVHIVHTVDFVHSGCPVWADLMHAMDVAPQKKRRPKNCSSAGGIHVIATLFS